MSKKILKRSLALGALMAFVITGSAFADCKWGDNGYTGDKGERDDDYKYSSVTLTENTELERVSWSGIRQINGNLYAVNPDYNTTYLNGYKLTIKNENAECAVHHGTHFDASTGRGFIICEDLPGYKFISREGEKLGDLEIISNKIGLHGYGKIDVNNLKITSGSGNAIQSGDADGTADSMPHSTTEIYANNIEIIGNSSIHNIIQAYNKVVIGSEERLVNKLTFSGTYSSAITAATDSNVKIYANEIDIASSDDGIIACLGGSIEIKAEKGNINSDIFAGGVHGGKGIVDLTLGSDVTLTGSVVTDTDSESQSNITLNGATWKVTGDSNISTLAGNDGKIVLGLRNEPAAAAYSLRSTGNNNAFYGLQIGNLTNSNLEVSGGAELTEAIENGTVDMTAEEALQQLAGAVTVTGEDSQEQTVSKVTVEAGDTLGETTATITANGTIASIKQDVNPQAAKVSKAATNLKAHYRAHMNDMNKRMGELRMANGEAGVWTRMVRGESEYEGAKMQYNQYQLGYDEKLSVDKRWTVGAAVTFAEGDGSYGQGSTDDKSTAFAIYGSKLNNDGTFVDLIARYAHLESDMEDSVYGNGDYSTNGYSVSAEFGKRIQQGNGLWVEPQVELTYGTVDSADFRLDKGYNAHFDSMDSFIARVGFSIGKDIKQGNVYARASYLYDFDGETTSLVTTTAGAGTPTPEDFGGGWWEVGVGANINLSKATYIYADIEKTFGGEVDTNWQWNLGVRYSF